MTRTLLSLKFRIVLNGITESRARLILSLLGYGVGLVGAIVGATRIAASAGKPFDAAMETIVTTFTIIFGLWTFGPLLVGGVDDALDPANLALLPLTTSELRKGLFFGALAGRPLPIVTTITLIGAVIGYSTSFGTALFLTFSAVTMLIFCLSASRALAVGLAFASRSRRGKDFAVLLASLGAATIFLGTQSIRFLRQEQKDAVVRAMRWLPTGQLATAILDVRTNQWLPAVIRVGALFIASLVLLRAWFRGIDRLLVDPDSIRHDRIVRSPDSLGLIPKHLRRWIAKPAVVMAAKELRYLVRSPQRRSSMIISIVIGTVFALLMSMRYNSANVLSVFGAPIAMLFGVHATNNLLGTDAASLWLEQTAGAKLRDQLIARGIAASPNLLIPTVLAAFVLAVMTGGWFEFAIVVLLCLTGWGIPLGIGSVISVLAPFNQPDSGNPYSNKRANSGQGGLVSALALVGILSLMLLSIPLMFTFGPGYYGHSVPGVAIGAIASLAYSCFVWRCGLRMALRVVRDREVDVLATIGGRRAAA